jgi:hypothetical protein
VVAQRQDKQRTENLSLSARKYSEGQVAQSVEQWTENPRVGGSIPPLATITFKYLRRRSLHCKGNILRRCPFDAHFNAALNAVALF